MNFILALITGVFCGLIINYSADVLPVTRNLTQPICTRCGYKTSLTDYLSFRKCKSCGKKKSIRFVVVFLILPILCVSLYYFPFSQVGFLESIPIIGIFGIILVIDFEHRLVLYQTSIFGFILFFVYGLILNGISSTLIGGLAGFGILLIFYLMGNGFSKVIGYLRKTEINEVAFGFGDVSLGTILGLLVGWPGILGAIIICMLSFVAFAVLYLIILIILRKYRAFSNTLPFTFFLVLGAIAVLYL